MVAGKSFDRINPIRNRKPELCCSCLLGQGVFFIHAKRTSRSKRYIIIDTGGQRRRSEIVCALFSLKYRVPNCIMYMHMIHAHEFH